MSYFEAIRASDSPSIDAFGRWRTSEPLVVFDAKQLFDNAPLFFDDAETSGSGTTSTYNTNQASTTIAVSAATAGTRVRQSFQRANYQPGKSQQILCTWGNLEAVTGVTKRVGYFDGENGLFFQNAGGTSAVVRRTFTSSSAVDNEVTQSSWNLDTMDGNGVSGITLDFTKTQIGIIDFEWLGVGRVRFGFVVNGLIYYCHELNNANNLDIVYMSNPDLPIRYEISNDGTGSADSFDHICSAVESEGGVDRNGVLRHQHSGSVSGLATGTKYAMIGLRLQPSKLGGIVEIENVSLITTTSNDKAHWELIFNPTVAGTFTYSDVTDSVLQVATGASTNTVTGGTITDGGFFTTSLPTTNVIPNAKKLGAFIDGTVEELILVCQPITNNITVEASITWREVS